MIAARNASRYRSCEPFSLSERTVVLAFSARIGAYSLLIARAYGATGSIAFSIPGRPGGLADEKCKSWLLDGRTRAMSQSKDVRDAVESELGYEPMEQA
jgi:hypothetical protein